ncbi:nucleotidyltransferase domain-containing protein [Aeromonas caviae]
MSEYIENLKQTFPAITDIWLIGSQANGNAKPSSDWDFLVFSESSIFEEVKKNTSFHRPDVDLLLVEEYGEFSKPFGEPKGGSLLKWKWQQNTEETAQYEGCKWVPDEEAVNEGFDDLGQIVCKALNAYRV